MDIDERPRTVEPSKLPKNGNGQNKEHDSSQSASKPRLAKSLNMGNSLRVVIEEDPSMLHENKDFSEVKMDFSKVLHKDSMKVENSDTSQRASKQRLEEPLNMENSILRVDIEEDPSKSHKSEDLSEVKIDFSMVDHKDSRKVENSADLSNAPSEDLPLTIIKVFKKILMFGTIAIKKGYTIWLKILKDILKSPPMKVIFYILRVFGRILYFKESEKVKPVNSDQASEEHALTLKEDSTESKINPLSFHPAQGEDTSTLKDSSFENGMSSSNLNPVPEKYASTVEESSLECKENPLTSDLEHSLTIKDDSVVNVPCSKAKSPMRTPHSEKYPNFDSKLSEKISSPSEDKVAMTISGAQEILTKESIVSGIKTLPISLPEAKDPVISDELLIEPQEPEIALDSVQTALDWAKGTRSIKRLFYIGKLEKFEKCTFCETNCKEKFYELLSDYKKEVERLIKTEEKSHSKNKKRCSR